VTNNRLQLTANGGKKTITYTGKRA
jgi:hypothetical protein